MASFKKIDTSENDCCSRNIIKLLNPCYILNNRHKNPIFDDHPPYL
jgi:hypothetical protein